MLALQLGVGTASSSPRPQFPDGEPGSQEALLFMLVTSILVPSPPRLPTSYNRNEHGHPRRGPQQDPPPLPHHPQDLHPGGLAYHLPREGKEAVALQGERSVKT